MVGTKTDRINQNKGVSVFELLSRQRVTRARFHYLLDYVRILHARVV